MSKSSDRPWCQPIFRWAGSKRKLLPVLLRLLPADFERYVEPFAGSACLFFALKPHKAVLADINSELMDSYVTILRHPRLVARAAGMCRRTAAEYYRLRACEPDTLSAVDKAGRFLYLNRFCFNGVYRVNREGVFNVPRGRNTGSMPSEAWLYRSAMALRNAELRTDDFEATLERTQRGDLVYLDPPYAPRGRPAYGEYGYGTFRETDLARFFAALARAHSRGVKMIMSYADSKVVRLHLASWKRQRITVRRHVAGFAKHRVLVREILATNY
jgi:DNA adenine methylase